MDASERGANPVDPRARRGKRAHRAAGNGAPGAHAPGDGSAPDGSGAGDIGSAGEGSRDGIDGGGDSLGASGGGDQGGSGGDSAGDGGGDGGGPIIDAGSLGDGSDKGRARSRGRPTGTGTKAKAPTADNLDSVTYSVAIQMAMDGLAKTRGEHFRVNWDDCDTAGVALQEFLKTAKPNVRKTVNQIIGPLMLMSAFAALLGPGIKHEMEAYKDERLKRASAKVPGKEAAAKSIGQGAGVETGDQGHPEGREGLAHVEDGFTGPESAYF